MTTDENEPARPAFFQFGLLGLMLFVSVIALWLAMWRAVGVAGILFVTACVPTGLLIYAAACAGARFGHPMLTGVLAGLGSGIVGTFLVYGWLDGAPLGLGDFLHLTITGLALGAACGGVAWVKKRRSTSPRH